jgi:excisionase family DNA binding protein
MSHLPGILAKELGVSRRTFERWCKRGYVPGAYRTKGGHWRIRRPSKQIRCKLLSLDYCNTLEGRIVSRLCMHFFPAPPEIKRKIEAYLKDPLFREGMTNGRLSEIAAEVAWAWYKTSGNYNDQELDQLSYNTPLGKFIRPDHWLAAERPTALLMATAAKLRLNQNNATAASLARELGMSRQKLRKKYGQDNVEVACALAGPGRAVFEPNEEERKQLIDFIRSLAAPKAA